MPASAGQALQRARAALAATSQNARRDAEVLLAHVLACDQAALLTHPERLLSQEECTQYDNLILRRTACEPIQYLTGQQEFFGLVFAVSPAVLIPRPETEHLVEAALERVPPDARIVDVGTGSGAIAIALAHALPQANVIALDTAPAALAVARHNAALHGVAERVTFLQSDLLEAIAGDDFDAVVANPPYIAQGEVLEPQVSRYEPHGALYAGPTGLEIYLRLIPQAPKRLRPAGWLMLEMGFGQGPALRELLSGWSGVNFLNDLRGIPRVAVAKP